MYKAVEIRRLIDNTTPLTTDEIYDSLLPEYLYYVTDEKYIPVIGDLKRLPILIKKLKKINCHNQVEDLEDILINLKMELI